jgi:hypothetical protein
MARLPKEFDFFCPIENRVEEDAWGNREREYYVHVPKWIWRAMRERRPAGFVRVHFGKGSLYNGYSFEQHKRLEREITKYTKSDAYRRLRKRMGKEECAKQNKGVCKEDRLKKELVDELMNYLCEEQELSIERKEIERIINKQKEIKWN